MTDNRVCRICDGGPGNDCACTCGSELWETTMTDKTEPALEPCPFCGGDAYIANPEPNALWRVICTSDCGAGNYVSNRTSAIAAWNTRTTPAPSGDEVDRLRAALERAASDAQTAVDMLGNSGPEFNSVQQGFNIIADRCRQALKGTPA